MNHAITPSILSERENFVIKLAEDAGEVEQALRLRYEVFAEEQGRLDGGAGAGTMDKDPFDDYCMHLVVIDKPLERVVGTYRVHPGGVARRALGFYAEREYKIDNIGLIADDVFEVGRSCVAREYRNGAVVGLLWAGIAALRREWHPKYMLGCVSLEERDPALGWALHEYFANKNLMDATLCARARESFCLPSASRREIDAYLTEPRRLIHALPPLFKAYLRVGVTICGEPAWDQEFGSIDFLILLNFDTVPEKYARHFGGF